MSLSQRPNTALVDGAIGMTLFRFSLPILAGNILQSLNGSVNAIWVGHYLGEAALTATSVANTILFFLLGTIFGVGMAATILVGQSMGAKNIDQAKRVVGTSVSFFLAISILAAALGFVFAPHLMQWMHTPVDAQALAVAYLRIIFIGLPSMYMLAFISMILRGAGDTRTPFYFLLMNVALDIVLNPLFIFGWGPVPRMGIAGAATATLCAQTISVLTAIVYLYRSKHFLRIQRGEGRFLRIDRAVLGALIGKGVPMGLQMVVMSLTMIALISLVNRFGSQTTAAYGACFQLWNYIQMPAFAIGMAVSSMCAQNVGAGRWDRVNRIAVVGVGYNLLMTGAMVALVLMFNRPVLGLFLPADGIAIAIAQHINAIAVWSFIAFGIAMVLGGVMRSTGAVIPPLIILFVALWVVRVPFAYATVDRLQADAIWWSFPLGSLVSMTLSIVYYRFGNWRKARMLATQSSPQALATSTTASGAVAVDAHAASVPEPVEQT